MNPLTLVFRLPLMPLQSVIRLAGVIGEHAEQELHDPARVRRELEEAETRRASGEISDEELSRVQGEATSSLIRGQARGDDDWS